MSQETVEPVRQKLSLRERSSGRTPEQRLAVRFPWFLALWSRLIVRLAPASRLRQALVLRTVQGGFEAYNRGDLEVVVLAYHPDVEFQQPPEFADHGELGLKSTYRGHEGFREFQADWLSGWGEHRMEPRELIDLGDRLLVLVETTASGEGGGVSVTQSMALLDTLDNDGKVIREQRYFNHAAALEAVGLTEPPPKNA